MQASSRFDHTVSRGVSLAPPASLPEWNTVASQKPGAAGFDDADLKSIAAWISTPVGGCADETSPFAKGASSAFEPQGGLEAFLFPPADIGDLSPLAGLGASLGEVGLDEPRGSSLHVAAKTSDAVAALKRALVEDDEEASVSGAPGALSGARHREAVPAEILEAGDDSLRAIAFFSYIPVHFRATAKPSSADGGATSMVVVQDVACTDVVQFHRLVAHVASLFSSSGLLIDDCQPCFGSDAPTASSASAAVPARAASSTPQPLEPMSMFEEDDLDDMLFELDAEADDDGLQDAALALLKEAIDTTRAGRAVEDQREEAARSLARRAAASPDFRSALLRALAATGDDDSSSLLQLASAAVPQLPISRAFPVCAALRQALSSSVSGSSSTEEQRKLLATWEADELPCRSLAEPSSAEADSKPATRLVQRELAKLRQAALDSSSATVAIAASAARS